MYQNEGPRSINNVMKIISLSLSLQFPEDFFDLWSYCRELNPENPREALVPLVNYRLIGPFDALAMKNNIDVSDKKAFNLHCRYYYDPPEFQTLMVEVNTFPVGIES